jgi:mannose-6-phosphate isomerase-like protein (cupin superfamily)
MSKDKPPGANFVDKPWGSEEWIVNTDKYCGKVMFVKKGHSCSWHYHRNKEETFLVVHGMIRVHTSKEDDKSTAEERVMSLGTSMHIYPGVRHSFYAITDAKIIEFSTHHEDSDSHRIGEP